MFEKKEYIMDSTFGVCMVEKVTKLVVGREQQMEYYVLQSAADKKKKAKTLRRGGYNVQCTIMKQF